MTNYNAIHVEADLLISCRISVKLQIENNIIQTKYKANNFHKHVINSLIVLASNLTEAY